MPEAWRVGVDAGGSWLRLLAVDQRGRWRRIRVPAPRAGDLPQALGGIWRRQRWRRSCVARLVVATRGVWTLAERRHMRARLRGLAQHVTVMSDAEAAYLGALGGRPGVLVLAGTGSIVLSRDERGRFFRVGGLGPLFGDPGSAFALGRDWLASTDQRRALRLARAPDAVARIAAMAPRVLRLARRGDESARFTVARAGLQLARDIRTAARSARLGRPITVSWAGSLLGNAGYRDRVWRIARGQGVVLAPVTPVTTALEAVARLAATPRAQAR